MDKEKKYRRILQGVQKPARYTGGEYGAIMKDKRETKFRFCFCFPDTYEVGMSHLGLRILYALLNNMDGVWCERAFAPWVDMEAALRENGLPLCALESGDSLAEFDMLGFSLQYELSYTNVLNMLSLAGISLLAKDRQGLKNIVIAGGPCAYNPEPMADFFDLFVIGEAEEALPELTTLYLEAKESSATREEFLRHAAKIEGVYVPSLYDVEYLEDGRVKSITPKNGAPERVRKRLVQDMDTSFFPESAIVPSTGIVHDRVMLELFRGCPRGCRFCQAGHISRPVRFKSPEVLTSQAESLINQSGYEEISLASLSTSDYPKLNELCDNLLSFCEGKGVSLSLPSLRADSFSLELMEKVQRVRKSGLTFAPEAGSQRLRDAINKNVTEEDLLSACGMAFSGGWSGVKLYFMLGLPTETEEDILGIADLARKVFYTWRQTSDNRARGVRITVSTAGFVPKPHTPFQWEPQITMEEYRRRVSLLRDDIKRTKVLTYNWHDEQTTYLEGALSRGDRRVGRVILNAFEKGCRLDGWDELFSLSKWEESFSDAGLEMSFYANRQREFNEVLPWDHIDCMVKKEFLIREAKRSRENEKSRDCRQNCEGCGVSSAIEEDCVRF